MWSRKRLSWINLQNLWNCKVFKFYGIHCVFNSRYFAEHLWTYCVIKLIVSLGNFICSHGLKCHQLRELSSEIEAEYLGLTYPTAVLCLSSGKVLLYYFELRAQIEIFPNEKNHLQPQWLNPWLAVEIKFCCELDNGS